MRGLTDCDRIFPMTDDGGNGWVAVFIALAAVFVVLAGGGG